MANIDTAKQWFETGDYPTQQQFWQTFDWLRWKDEGIDVSDVAGLQSLLNTIQATLNSILPNTLFSGGLVTIKSDDGTNVVVQIPATSYALKGIAYAVDHSEITIVRPVDETLSRFDVFYLDETGFHVLKGTESTTPVKPQLTGGMALTSILIGFNNTLDVGPMPGTPNLQAVTLAGNITTLPLISKDSLQAGQAATDFVGKIKADNLTATWNYQLPDKAGTFALLDDVTGAGAVIDDTAPSTAKVYSSQKTEDLASTKVDKVAGKGLSTEDYTTAEKTKLSGIAAGAQVNDANTTLQGNVFNGVNQLVKLDGAGKLPAIDGSQLTNLPSGGGGVWGSIGGTLSDQTDLITYISGQVANGNTAFGWGNHALAGYLTSASSLAWSKITGVPNITIMGNLFNGVNQLVQLDGAGKLPAIDGSQLTNLPTGSLWTKNADNSIQYSLGTVSIIGSGLSVASFINSGNRITGREIVAYVAPTVGLGFSTTPNIIGGNQPQYLFNCAPTLNAPSGPATPVYGFYYHPAITNDTAIQSIAFMNTSGDNFFNTTKGSTGIGTATINASAILDVASTTKGVRFSPMTGSQMAAIPVTSAAEGIEVYNTTLHKKCLYNGSAWVQLTDSSDAGGTVTNVVKYVVAKASATPGHGLPTTSASTATAVIPLNATLKSVSIVKTGAADAGANDVNNYYAKDSDGDILVTLTTETKADKISATADNLWRLITTEAARTITLVGDDANSSTAYVDGFMIVEYII